MEDTMQLSPSALLVLRFRANKWPMKHDRPDAYRELVAAVIMTLDGEDFKFTKDGWNRREEYFAEAEAHQRSLEPKLSGNIELSDAARAVLERHLAGDTEVTDVNRPVVFPPRKRVSRMSAIVRCALW
jgi:hypothetical protein